MKKTFFAFVLALAMLLCACTAPAPGVKLAVMGDSSPMPGFDADNKYTFLPTESIWETEDRFYFNSTAGASLNWYHRIYDKATGALRFACEEPKCGHGQVRKEDKDAPRVCPARSRGHLGVYYNDQRWWLIEPKDSLSGSELSLYCSDLSGGNTTLVKHIDYEERSDLYPFYNAQYAIHRGNLFLWETVDEWVDGALQKTCVLLASPLDATADFVTLYREPVEGYSEFSVHFAGTKVYCALRSSVDGGLLNKLRITTYDVAARQSQTLYAETMEVGTWGRPWISVYGKLYLSTADGEKACLWKVEEDKRTQITVWEGQKEPACIVDGVAAVFWKDGEVWGCDIRDFSGNILCQTDKIFPDKIDGISGSPNWHYDLSVLGGGREKLLVVLEPVAASSSRYTVAVDPDNQEAAHLLWKSLGV